MAGFNRIVLVGNLTRDPEYKQLSSGQAVCRLGLATNRQFKNRQTGNMVQEVCYVDIDVWGAQAESCRQYLQKGRQVLIEGRLKFDTWEDPQGQARSKHSIVADRVLFLSGNVNTEETDTSDMHVEAKNELEQNLLDQIEQIKTRTKEEQKKQSKKDSSQKQDKKEEDLPQTGEINFQDQPPFEDDLPF